MHIHVRLVLIHSGVTVEPGVDQDQLLQERVGKSQQRLTLQDRSTVGTLPQPNSPGGLSALGLLNSLGVPVVVLVAVVLW
jgi:hypothetical protein